MKSVIPFIKKFGFYFCILCMMLLPVTVKAQLCTNSLDSVYSMTTNGQFHSINVNNGNASVGILGGAAVSNAFNSNGVGFSQVTGRFYFFNHCADSPNPNEFVSYNPLTGSKVILANPPPPMTNASADKIRTGTVNNTGTGYYTILTTSPSNAATLYYYNIGTNTWKIIAQAFKDTATGLSMDSMFNNLNSGDMTFDGSGNLWIICSKNPKFALYKVSAPVTTNTVPKLAVSVMIPTRNMPIASSAASITGVAFNSAGRMFFTTGSNSALAVGANTAGTHYNILYRMRTITPLVIDSISNLRNSYGDDLTSCTYPPNVLAVSSLSNFMAILQNNSVKLSWKVDESEDVTGYDIEFSNDAEHWQTIYHMDKNSNSPGFKTYSYVHTGYSQGRNYYRIVQRFQSDNGNISETRSVDTRNIIKINIGPNPVNDVIYIYNKDNNAALLARVFDNTGRLVYSTFLSPDQQSINISRLPKGNFILRLSASNTNESSAGYHFIKW
jgi:Secretion system C-terminal sorting domain